MKGIKMDNRTDFDETMSDAIDGLCRIGGEVDPHFETAVLCEIVKDCRTYIEARECTCFRYKDELCGRCAMLARIDADF